jgi:two-component sensor histidine kinase
MAARTPIHPDTAHSLALAMVAASNAPLLLLDGDMTIIAASASFTLAFQIDPDAVVGRKLHELGAGEWDLAQLRSLLEATLSGDGDIEAYELDLRSPRRETRRLLLNAQKLNYGDPANVRLLLTISDVTDARLSATLMDDMLQERAILLQEVQHRVANSLQIIASLLMLNARRVQSDETRMHLFDAHNRVMSVAAVQQQLASSALGDVELRPYFTKLCDSLGASMIRDPKTLVLSVDAGEGAASADVSMSLGLIVTELVINALKHAFPGRGGGKIVIGYHGDGANWTLSVTDNGVGMPKDRAGARPGLGTSIIEALAKHLRARVEIADAHPGTAVSIVH